MSLLHEQISTVEDVLPNVQSVSEIYYPETDGEEIGETAIHYKLIHYLFGALQAFFASRNDVFIASNLMLYYEEGNPRKYYAPDLMVVFGVANADRSSYQVWKENQFPQVIVEVASEKTYEQDLGKKYADYGRLGVEEHYLLDPANEFLPAPIMAYRRENNRLILVPSSNNRVFSPRLNLEFVLSDNQIRLFNPATNEFLRTLLEVEAENARLREEIAKLKQIN